MRIEIRWLGPTPRAKEVHNDVVGVNSSYMGMTLGWNTDYHGLIEVVNTEVSNWSEFQTRIEHHLLPTICGRGAKDAAIHIEGMTMGGWLAEQEKKVFSWREVVEQTIVQLKQTRRLLPNKRIETLWKSLARILETDARLYHAKPTAK